MHIIIHLFLFIGILLPIVNFFLFITIFVSILIIKEVIFLFFKHEIILVAILFIKLFLFFWTQLLSYVMPPCLGQSRYS